MPELQRLRADHADQVLEFERVNRAYFAASISDRGDDYFERFSAHHEARLADQATGRYAFYLLVEEGGSVVGRFNLFEIGDGLGELGYRVAKRAACRGLATASVQEMCRLAASTHGVRKLVARTTDDNVASQRVLEKAGFVPVGTIEIKGKRGRCYERILETTAN